MMFFTAHGGTSTEGRVNVDGMIVAAAFGQRRKTLRNALAGVTDKLVAVARLAEEGEALEITNPDMAVAETRQHR